MRAARLIGACAAAVAIGVTVAACGGASTVVVATVGATKITKATLDRWSRAVRAGVGTAAPSQRRGNAARATALQVLITLEWLIGEAARLGLSPSRQEVHRQVEERQASFVGGQAEFHISLQAKGLSVADAELQAAAELASTALHSAAGATARAVNNAQVALYYRQNRDSHVVPERRVVRISTRKTRAEAEALRRRVLAGGSLTSVAQRKAGEGFMTIQSTPAKATAWEKVLYAARPHVLVGPVKIGVDYLVFEVEKTTPASNETLPQVAGAIQKQLTDQRQEQALRRFIAAWRARWTARTNCRSGYVVQKCRQYTGPKAPEDSLALD